MRAIEKGHIEASDGARAAAAAPASDHRALLARLSVDPIYRGGPGYPEALEGIADGPDLLFVRGSIPPSPAVAVVGTRRATAYGRSLARAYGRAVASSGWTLVSGLARGIDGEAHRGTVEGRGEGVGVLGSGPDVWYPAEHRSLGERLVELGGAVVTEYAPGTPPEGWRFPPRNRIISGLARALVVVEAADTGGALVTAAAALEQGRTVFAVPGDVDRETSRGANRLIRDGAHPVLDPADLVEELSLVLGPAAARPDPRGTSGDGLLDQLGATGRSLDELAVALDEPVSQVLARVARLEAAGAVCRRGERVEATGRPAP